jgi:hypothetical protein
MPCVYAPKSQRVHVVCLHRSSLHSQPRSNLQILGGWNHAPHDIDGDAFELLSVDLVPGCRTIEKGILCASSRLCRSQRTMTVSFRGLLFLLFFSWTQQPLYAQRSKA